MSQRGQGRGRGESQGRGRGDGQARGGGGRGGGMGYSGDGGRGRGDGARGRGDGGRGQGNAGRGRGGGGGRGEYSGRGRGGGQRDSDTGQYEGRFFKEKYNFKTQPVEVFREGQAIAPPSAEVAKLEAGLSKALNSLAGQMRQMRLDGKNVLPLRPGFGTLGQPIVVYANYFQIIAKENLELHKYNIKIAGDLQPSQAKRKRIITLLLEDLNLNQPFRTNFRDILVTTTPILAIKQGIQRKVIFRAEGEDLPKPNPVVHDVLITYDDHFLVSDILSYLDPSNTKVPAPPDTEKVIQVLNAAFNHGPYERENIAAIISGTGLNKYFNLTRNDGDGTFTGLGNGIEAMRGFIKSVRLGTGRLLLNVNVTSGVFVQPCRLDELIRRFNEPNFYRLGKKLKGLRVKRTHLPERRNKSGKSFPSAATIWGLASREDGRSLENPPIVKTYGAGPKDVEFWLRPLGSSPSATKSAKGGKAPAGSSGATSAQGRYISVLSYFQQTYPGIEINPNKPVVNIGSLKAPSYLPAEVCEVLPGQQVKKKLTPSEVQKMVDFACRRPKLNADAIAKDGKVVLGLNAPDKAGLANLGLSVSETLITVAARILAPPQIKYKDAKSQITPRFGGWNMSGAVRFCQGGSVSNWTYLCMTSPNDVMKTRPESDALVASFVRFMAGMGMSFTPRASLPTNVPANDPEQIRNVLRQVKEKGIKWVLFILPFADTRLYKLIKSQCDVTHGIHSVCVVANKIILDRMKVERQGKDAAENSQAQYFANVALKFNLKAGGVNQSIAPAKLGIISEGKTMVIGLDVTHPSPGAAATALSVAGMVASVDSTLAQWPGVISVQKPSAAGSGSAREMVDDLTAMLKSRLELWQSRNKTLPDNILVFRDGVSEGQYDLVLNSELPLLRAACEDKTFEHYYKKAGMPKMTVVVVGKRHHTRFYPTKKEDAANTHNCKPGTVVDRGVTQARSWEFFLQAHHCLQGTARPAHYVVLHDEIFRGLKPKADQRHQHAADALEDLAHNMCHLFGRATKAVSICPPAYYADILCERARCYLAQHFDPDDASSVASAPAVLSQMSQHEIDHLPQQARDNLLQQAAQLRHQQQSLVNIHPALKDTMFYI